MLLLWQRELAQKENDYLPVVLPIVLYTGEKQWENSQTIIDWLGGDRIDPSLHPFIPQYEFLFYNISSEAKEHLIKSHILRTYIQLNKLLPLDDMECIYLMIRELERLGEMKYFETIVLYLIHVTESFSVDHLKEHLTMEGRQKLMTVAEKLRQEGIEIGISEGIEIGRSEGIKIGKSERKLEEKRSFALRLLKLKMSE